jgi:hypothetical protein
MDRRPDSQVRAQHPHPLTETLYASPNSKDLSGEDEAPFGHLCPKLGDEPLVGDDAARHEDLVTAELDQLRARRKRCMETQP